MIAEKVGEDIYKVSFLSSVGVLYLKKQLKSSKMKIRTKESTIFIPFRMS